MIDPFKDNEYEKRNKDVPKPSLKNETDRKVIITIVCVAIGILVIGVLVAILLIMFMK